jgi:ketosteroid isomerase-like protein
MLKTSTILFVLILSAAAGSLATGTTKEETQVWDQEKAYWEYVQTNDLEKYRALWHDDFIGWPSVSSEPVHKDQITDWITANTSNGLQLQSYKIEQRAIKVTGNVAIDHYRVTTTWAKNNPEKETKTSTTRITHTWIRTKEGAWQILGGMSAPVNAEGR